MSDTQTEACGRCSMSTVVDAVADDESNADRDLLTGDQIEVSETTLSRVAPGAWLGRVTTRLNDVAQQLTYDR